MARISLRARLALITVVTVAVALIVANIAISRYLSSSLLDRRDDQLNTLVRYANAALSRPEGARPEGVPPEATIPNQNTGEEDIQLPLDLAAAYAEIRDRDGEVVSSGFLFGDTREPPEIPRRLILDRSGSGYFDTETADGTPYRAIAVEFPENDTVVVAALPLTGNDETNAELLLIQVIASAAVIGVTGALVWWLIGMGLRPLRRIERTAAAIAGGDLSERVEPAGHRTEIERLGATLNQMLAEIEDAFAAQAASESRLREFISDASHELRTPLTTLRGYTELFERGAADDPAFRATAMRRVHEETVRMSRLVNDLLLLAQLDEERQLESELIDLVKIVGDIAADARIIDPNRTVAVTAPEQLTVTGDRARLTQVIANLVTNARTHTPAGSPIEILLLTTDGAEAAMSVIDHGPGVDPELGSRIFGRFVRHGASQHRTGSRGTGLGLAIVAAIITAHDGRCGVEATPGGGATFWIRLPLARADTRAVIESSGVRS